MKIRVSPWWLAMLAFSLSACCLAEDAPAGRIKAGIFINPPFVVERPSGGYTGLAVDLWEDVADALDLHNDYIVYDDIAKLIQDTAAGVVDVAAFDLSATHERAKILKFSYPWYDSGLRIMVNRDAGGSLWASLSKYKHFRVYLLFFSVFIILTIILTLMRRKHDPEFTDDWKAGLSQSFLNIVESALSGKMEQRYLGWLGNLFFIGWLLFGVAAVAYITSTMTSAMTSTRLIGHIRQPADLPGKRVGVLHGSVGEAFFRRNNENIASYANLPEAVEALLEGGLDAIVSDAPLLEYHAHENSNLPLAVVGDLFRPDKYCFASGYANAGLMDRATVQLINLRESGRIAELKDKYFSGDDEEEELAWPGEE